MKIIFYKTKIKNWHTFCAWKLRYYSPLNEWQLNWICEQQDNPLTDLQLWQEPQKELEVLLMANLSRWTTQQVTLTRLLWRK